MRKTNIGLIQVVVAAIMWGSLGIFGRQLNSLGVSPVSIVATRILIAFLGLSVYFALFIKRLPKVRKKDFGLFVVYTLLSVVAYNIFYFSAISLVPIALAAILLYLSPIFVLGLSAVFLKEKLSFIKIIAVTVVVIGIVLVLNLREVDQISLLGLLYGVGAGLTFALYSVLGKKLMKKNNPRDIVMLSFGLGGLGLLLMAMWQGDISFAYSPTVWTLLLALGLGPTLLAFMLYNMGLQKIKASQASILSTLEPVTAALLGALLLSESLNTAQVVGIIIVTLGITLISRAE